LRCECDGEEHNDEKEMSDLKSRVLRLHKGLRDKTGAGPLQAAVGTLIAGSNAVRRGQPGSAGLSVNQLD
jgi:hypothetical protein